MGETGLSWEVFIITIDAVINVMNETINVHRKVLELSKEKTEYIKTGDMEQLSKILVKERKHVQEMEQIEQKREKIVEQTFNHFNIPDEKEKTVSVLLDHVVHPEEKQRLETVVTELLEVIIELRRSEQLNRELLEQSMQFVQLSLELLQPSERKINYQKNDKNQVRSNRSVFDSKA